MTGSQVVWSQPRPCSSSTTGPGAGLHEGAAVAVDRDELDLVAGVRTRCLPGSDVRMAVAAIQPDARRLFGTRIPLIYRGFTRSDPWPGPLASRRGHSTPRRDAATSGPPTPCSGRPARSAPPRWPGWSRTCPGSASSAPRTAPGSGMIVQAGIRGFVDWYRARRRPARPGGTDMVASVFGAAPRALAGVITLQQTVDLVRLSIEVVESNIDELARPGRRAPTCTPPCSATPARSPSPPPRSTPAPPRCAAPGTPGSRPSSSTRCCAPRPTRPCSPGPAPSAGAAAATWPSCSAPSPARPHRDRPLRRGTPGRAGPPGMDALCAVQGDRLVVRARRRRRRRARPPRRVADLFGDGPVVVGPVGRRPRPAPTSPRAPRCRRTAPPPAGRRRPRPVRSDDLLPERALAGDGHARRHLVEEVYLPLLQRPRAP